MNDTGKSLKEQLAEEAVSVIPKRTGKPRGFAGMDPKLVSEIARKGGKAAHEKGTAHEFTSAEAREAGHKGGKATHARRGPKSQSE